MIRPRVPEKRRFESHVADFRSDAAESPAWGCGSMPDNCRRRGGSADLRLLPGPAQSEAGVSVRAAEGGGCRCEGRDPAFPAWLVVGPGWRRTELRLCLRGARVGWDALQQEGALRVQGVPQLFGVRARFSQRDAQKFGLGSVVLGELRAAFPQRPIRIQRLRLWYVVHPVSFLARRDVDPGAGPRGRAGGLDVTVIHGCLHARQRRAGSVDGSDSAAAGRPTAAGGTACAERACRATAPA